MRLMLALRRMVSNHPRGLQSSKVSRDRNARSNVSCTRPSASYPLPVTARATRNVRNDDHVEPDVRGRRSSVGLIRPHLVGPSHSVSSVPLPNPSWRRILPSDLDDIGSKAERATPGCGAVRSHGRTPTQGDHHAHHHPTTHTDTASTLIDNALPPRKESDE